MEKIPRLRLLVTEPDQEKEPDLLEATAQLLKADLLSGEKPTVSQSTIALSLLR